ncbi:MAG: nitrogenase-stabilizing/protective protein NifW [Solirubrobacteraceae bacterium]
MSVPTSEAGSATERLGAFRRAGTAEEYFAVLGVAYDPRVLAVSRLHILRHFGAQAAQIDKGRAGGAGAGCATDETVFAAYRRALQISYDAFTSAGALDHRLFKVLQDYAPVQIKREVAR